MFEVDKKKLILPGISERLCRDISLASSTFSAVLNCLTSTTGVTGQG